MVMQRVRERLSGGNGSSQVVKLEKRLSELEGMAQNGQMVEILQERLAELELSLEDANWGRLSGMNDRDFSRDGLKTINKLARLYFLKNPLIKRAVLTQALYVFGQGMSVVAEHPLVNDLIQEFIDDPHNKKELTEQQSRMVKEIELQCFGNLFFVFFINKKAGGKVRVRCIPCDEIQEIITNPDDAKEPWYYKRTWMETTWSDQGIPLNQSITCLYPDWRYHPKGGIPKSAYGQQVEDAPVYHVAVNKLSDMMFGVSEVYAAIDWARAYKEFLENWATIVKSYARFAWQLTLPEKSGAANVAAAKAKLGTTMGSFSSETNPAPVTASTFIGTQGIKMDAIKTAGATTSAEDGRQLRLMVCSATGIFEHYLTGDPSTGNLATAKAMELPMLIQFRNRQQLWTSIISEIAQFLIDCSVIYGGPIKGKITADDLGEPVTELAPDSDNDDPEKAKLPISRVVTPKFPDILEKDILARVNAIVDAATLKGQVPAGTIEAKLLTRMLLEALGVDEIDAILDLMFPPDENGQTQDGQQKPPMSVEARESQFMEALAEVKRLVKKLADPKVMVSA